MPRKSTTSKASSKAKRPAYDSDDDEDVSPPPVQQVTLDLASDSEDDAPAAKHVEKNKRSTKKDKEKKDRKVGKKAKRAAEKEAEAAEDDEDEDMDSGSGGHDDGDEDEGPKEEDGDAKESAQPPQKKKRKKRVIPARCVYSAPMEEPLTSFPKAKPVDTTDPTILVTLCAKEEGRFYFFKTWQHYLPMQVKSAVVTDRHGGMVFSNTPGAKSLVSHLFTRDEEGRPRMVYIKDPASVEISELQHSKTGREIYIMQHGPFDISPWLDEEEEEE